MKLLSLFFFSFLIPAAILLSIACVKVQVKRKLIIPYLNQIIFALLTQQSFASVRSLNKLLQQNIVPALHFGPTSADLIHAVTR